MNLQNILDKLVSGQALDSGGIEVLQELLMEYSSRFTKPEFSAGQTAISRRDLNVWGNENMIPFSRQEDERWKRYSLVECYWLQIVSKLKKMGVANTLIVEYKEMLFDQSAKSYRDIIKNAEEMNNLPPNAIESLDKMKKMMNEVDDEALEEEIIKSQFSIFGVVTMMITLYHLNYSIIIYENGDMSIVNLGKPLIPNGGQVIDATLTKLSQNSFIAINLNQIIFNFLQNDKLLETEGLHISILNPKERKLVDEIRNGKYKKITVNIKDGSITHLKPTKSVKENELLIKQFSRLLKKGDYKQIHIIAVDGNIVEIDQEETIKF
jgi:DNA-binding transcriptional MerR regulator